MRFTLLFLACAACVPYLPFILSLTLLFVNCAPQNGPEVFIRFSPVSSCRVTTAGGLDICSPA